MTRCSWRHLGGVCLLKATATVVVAGQLACGARSNLLDREPEPVTIEEGLDGSTARSSDATIANGGDSAGQVAPDTGVAAPPSSVDASSSTADAMMPSDAAEDQSDGPSAVDGGLPSTAACLTGGNVLWVEGEPNSLWLAGAQTDAKGSAWTTQAESDYAMYDGVYISVTLPGSTLGTPWWGFQFDTWPSEVAMDVGVDYVVNYNLTQKCYRPRA